MKELKTVKLLSTTGHKVKKAFGKDNLKRNIVILASLGIIGGAIYLNWNFFSVDSSKAESTVNEIVSGNNDESDSYFAMTEVTRQRTRDEAMEVLNSIVENESASQEDKTQAMSSIETIADNIQSEGNIESLVVSKGFENCVTVISDEQATVVVKSDGLLENEITQIQEIVYNETGILPENLKIIEKNS